MSAKLFDHSYGKSSVRITKVRRLADRHELVEMRVRITLSGDFARSYTHGDNSSVLATDSMKNTVYLLAKDHSLDSPESFALHLAKHFKDTYKQVSMAVVTIDQSIWRRIEIDGKPHPTAFESAGSERRHATARVDVGMAEVCGGLSDLLVLKTTDSSFTGFVRDEFTSLPESNDRILATKLSAKWWFSDYKCDFNSAYLNIRTAFLSTFADHKSLAVQQTLFDMGAAALASESSVRRLELRMPNKHRVPFNFKPFGKEFNNDIFVTTDEPSGEITGSLMREIT